MVVVEIVVRAYDPKSKRTTAFLTVVKLCRNGLVAAAASSPDVGIASRATN